MSDGPRVVGGSHDIEADVDDMFRTGGVLRRRGLDAGEVAVTCHGFLVDANLLHSAPFSPGSFATFEATLLGALDGPDGLTRHAVEMSVSGTVLQGRATAYYAFDRAQQMSLDVRAWAQGTALAGGVVATPVLLLGMAVTNPVGTLLLGTTASANREELLAAANAYVLEHPGVVEDLVAALPWTITAFGAGATSVLPPGALVVLTQLGLTPTSVPDGAALVASLYTAGRGEAHRVDNPLPTKPPANLAEHLVTLDAVNKDEGSFQIREAVGPDGEPVYTIYLPGTHSIRGPGGVDPSVQDMGTNFSGIAGLDNAYQQAVRQAMADYGIEPGDTVNFVGHSQGGIVAARLAQDLTDPDNPGGAYDVRQVVTAGSPVDDIELPESVQMLSLVNEHDLVPRFDGTPYHDASNHTTIVFAEQRGSVGENHALGGMYAAQAQSLQESTDPAVRDALAALQGTMGTDTGQHVVTYHATRK